VIARNSQIPPENVECEESVKSDMEEMNTVSKPIPFEDDFED
jgi:hypothetical protein